MVKNNELLSNAQLAQKRKNKIALIVAAVGAIIVVGAVVVWAVMNPPQIPAEKSNDATKDISLENNINFTGLVWDIGGTDFSDTPTGEWTLNKDDGRLTNPEYPGCSMFWTQAGSGVDDGRNDSENTDEFIAGLGGTRGENVYIPVKDETGQVEFATTRLVDAAGEQTWAIIRYASNQGVILLGKFTCEDEATLDVLSEKKISDYGIELVHKK